MVLLCFIDLLLLVAWCGRFGPRGCFVSLVEKN